MPMVTRTRCLCWFVVLFGFIIPTVAAQFGQQQGCVVTGLVATHTVKDNNEMQAAVLVNGAVIDVQQDVTVSPFIEVPAGRAITIFSSRGKSISGGLVESGRDWSKAIGTRVFHVKTGGSLNLQCLTLKNGVACSKHNGALTNGGLIYNDGGILSMKSCSLRDSRAKYGGAVRNGYAGTSADTAKMTAVNCLFSNGRADGPNGGHGGAIFNDGECNLTTCKIEGNMGVEKGGAIRNEKGTLISTDCIWERNKADLGGGLYNAKKMTLIRTIVRGNVGNMGGGLFSNGGSSTWLQKTVFESNEAGRGGLVFLKGTLYSSSSKGESNSATDGSAVYVADRTSGAQIVGESAENGLELSNHSGDHGAVVVGPGATDVLFSGIKSMGNQAKLGSFVFAHPGGSFVLTNSNSFDDTSSFDGVVYVGVRSTGVMDNCIIQRAKSLYGSGIIYAAGAVSVKVKNTMILDSQVAKMGSGLYAALIQKWLLFENVTMKNNIAAETTIYLENAPNATFRNCDISSNTASARNKALAMYARGTETEIILEGTTIKSNIGPAGSVRMAQGASMTAASGSIVEDQAIYGLGYWGFEEQAVDCKLTEYYTAIIGDAVPVGHSSQCQQCTEGMRCANASVSLATQRRLLHSFELEQGFWRNGPTASRLELCPLVEACRGGTNEQVCRKGHGGVLCGVCDNNYALTVGTGCVECTDSALGLIIFLVVVVLIIIVRAILIRLVNKGVIPMTDAYDALLDGFRTTLKMVLTFLQQIRGMAFVYSIVWPEVYTSSTSTLKYFALDIPAIVPFKCLQRSDHLHLVAGTLVLTVSLNAAAALLWVLGAKLKRPGLQSTVPNLVLGFNYALYISIANTLFSVFACKELDDGNSYMRIDNSVSCGTTRYNLHRIAAVIGVLVFVVGFPLAFGAALYRHRDVLGTSALDQKGARKTKVLEDHGANALRFLWKDYEQQYFMWEVMVCLQKTTVAGMLVFLPPESAIQLMVGLLVSLGWIVVYSLARPFTDIATNIISILSTVCVSTMFIGALLVKMRPINEIADVAAKSVLPGFLVFVVSMPLAIAAVATLHRVFTFRVVVDEKQQLGLGKDGEEFQLGAQKPEAGDCVTV